MGAEDGGDGADCRPVPVVGAQLRLRGRVCGEPLRSRWKIRRFIVSETPVNLAVLLSEVRYGEQDGTGDVYADLTLSEYRETGAVQIQAGGQTSSRPSESGGLQKTPQSYTVVKGATMWAIARKFYGDAALCWKLAAYNGIANANLIYPGQILKIPDKGAL